MKMEILLDIPDTITVVKVTTELCPKGSIYIRYEPKDFWHEYVPEWAHVRRVRYAEALQNLNTLLEEERKKICHPSL